MATVTRFTFKVCVLDGEGEPVPGVEVGARFGYPDAATTWSRATTDGDGCAAFDDEHPERPDRICFFKGDDFCDTFVAVTDQREFVIEL